MAWDWVRQRAYESGITMRLLKRLLILALLAGAAYYGWGEYRGAYWKQDKGYVDEGVKGTAKGARSWSRGHATDVEKQSSP